MPTGLGKLFENGSSGCCRHDSLVAVGDEMDELFKLLGFSTPFIYAAATYALFHWLDANASDEGKAAISRLLDLKDYDSKQVSAAFVEVFDRLYSSPLLDTRAFLRSSVITLAMSGVFM